MKKNTFLPIIIIVLSVLIIRGLLVSGSNPPDSSVADLSQANLHRADLQIEGMFCMGCRSSIVSSVKTLDGVIEADADPQTDSGWVIYDPEKTNSDQILALSIFDVYPASLISDKVYENEISEIETTEIPPEITEKLDQLTLLLYQQDINMESFFQEELDEAIEAGYWDKVNNLLDNYIEAYE